MNRRVGRAPSDRVMLEKISKKVAFVLKVSNLLLWERSGLGEGIINAKAPRQKLA